MSLVTERVTPPRLLRQFGTLSGARGLAAAVSFLWFALATRELAVPELADLTLLLSLGAMLSVVSDWGYAVVLNEAVAKDPATGRASFVLALRRRLWLVPIAAVGTAVLYLTSAVDRTPVVPLIYAVSLVASVVYTTATAALRGAGQVSPDAINEVLSRVVMLLLGGALVMQGAGVTTVVGVYAAIDVGSAVVLGAVAWRRLGSERPADATAFAASRLVPLGFASLIGLVYYRVDVWLLAVLSSAGEVARYSVCYRLLDGVIIPAGVLAVLVVGSTSTLALADARRKVDRMAGALCAAMLPIVAVFELAPGWILRVAFGAPYTDAAPVLRILAVAIIPTVAGLAWAPLAGLRGHGLVRVTAISLIGNLALNFVLVPPLGGEGAAIATVVGQVVFAALLRASLRERT